MTEAHGRAARWSAAALAAPVVAGLFAGTTAWAAHSDPLKSAAASTTPPAATPSASATTDATLKALRDAINANAAQVTKLSQQVAAVRAQAAALTGAAGKGGTVKGSSGGSRSGSTKRSSGGSSGGGTVVVTLPAPAPAPATHVTTGASGAPK